MEEIRQNPKCKDFIGVLYGFVYTGRKTETFTRERLRKLHRKIYGILAGLPRCQTQCSSFHKSQLNKWCETCSKWKKELLKVNRSRRVNWEETESWKWPDSYENIGDVFLPNDWTKTNLLMSDISTQCHIWQHCREFHLNKTIVKNVRTARNAIYHNSSFEITDTEKHKAFDALKDVIKDPDIANDIDVNKCLSELDDIFRDELFQNNNESVLERITAIYLERQGSNERRINEICDHLVTIEEQNRFSFSAVERLTSKLDTLDRYVKTLTKYPIHAIVIIFLCFTWMYLPNNIPNQGNVSPLQDGCVDENYSVPWKQDLPLLDYLRDTNPFVGREWLFEILNERLIQDKSVNRGIVSIAEFGYGKSAIVSHMLCARPGEKGRILREQIAAFHICKYDVSSTQSPERFIRRLVGFFAMKIPEYGNFVSLMSSVSILYDEEKCAKELEACFDQAIRFPFKNITTEFPTMIVVIDALDECYHLTKNKNFILDLISTRIQYFPKWIKFLITSRDMTELSSLKKLQSLYLLANASNNIKDIKSYLEIIYNERSSYFNTNMKRALMENSEGNFLYIVHALQYILSPEFNGTLPKLPLSLTDIYELNFDRQFQGGDSYAIAKLILEIVCTSLTPQSKTEIYEILKDSEASNMPYKDFEYEFVKLSYFIKTEDGVILRHKAIHSWLVESASSKYRVSPTMGHELISKHLLRTVMENGTGDILALVIHLSKSKNLALRKVFTSFDMKRVMSFKEEEILHNLISKTESEDALELLLLHHSNVDIADKNGISPIFLAASKGHLGQLKVLQRKGANVDFIVNPCIRCDTDLFLNDFKKVLDEIKTIFYSGYGLLHIAVQHGSNKVVKYLIEETNISVDSENVLGKRPADIACEMGNIDIVKLFMSKGSNIFDDKCLYFATRNSHLNIIKLILDSGYKPGCISNKTAETELSEILQSCNCDSESSRFSIKPLDTWWIVLRETPLHYAIRSGKNEITKLFAKKARHLLRCFDSYGYTPFLLAIKYNRFQLTKMIKKRANKDNCSAFAYFLKNDRLNSWGTIIQEKGEDICPLGASFAHLIAIYDQTEMAELFENETSLKWNEADNFGNKPVHYAAKHGSIRFIRFIFLKYGRKAYEEVTKNGSTAYHSAAISCSMTSIIELTNLFIENITDFRDYNNRSILHYALMCENNTLSYLPQNRLWLPCQKYFLKLMNISQVDSNEQNILHYVLRFGHHELLHYLYERYPLEYYRMFHAEDRYLRTPVTYTLFKAPDVNNIPRSDLLDKFTNKSLNKLPDDVKHSLLPWEICLIDSLKSISQEVIKDDFLRNFWRILIKSPFLSKALLVNNVFANASHVESTNIKRQIVTGMKWAKYLKRERIFAQSLETISVIRPSLLLAVVNL